MAIDANTVYGLKGSQIQDLATRMAALATQMGDIETALHALNNGSSSQGNGQE